MTLLVIGLDGATWSVIKPNLHRLPAFKQLLREFKHSVLECDVRPVHSSASWTTIFSGLLPEQHGITEFVLLDEKKKNALVEKNFFFWNKAKHPIVMCVPISLPPLNVNYELRDWQSIVLSITEEEMYLSTKKLLTDFLSAIKYGDSDFIAVVFSEPDRAQHLFWHEQEKVLRHYQSIDSALNALMPFLKENDFLILSDHGFTSAEETRRNNWDVVRENQTGGHHPLGIAISNHSPPEKTTQVRAFLEKHI